MFFVFLFKSIANQLLHFSLFSTDYQYLSCSMRDVDFKKNKRKRDNLAIIPFFLVTGTYLSAGEYIISWLPNLNYVWKNYKNEFNN